MRWLWLVSLHSAYLLFFLLFFQINALIMTGKLRSAYLTAAKTNRVQDITRIMAAAERMGQAAVRNICKKWLEQHQQTWLVPACCLCWNCPSSLCIYKRAYVCWFCVAGCCCFFTVICNFFSGRGDWCLILCPFGLESLCIYKCAHMCWFCVSGCSFFASFLTFSQEMNKVGRGGIGGTVWFFLSIWSGESVYL